MGREQHRVLFTDVADDFAGFLNLSWVETCSRFIKEQHFRVAKERLCKSNALAIAFGEFVNFFAGHGLKTTGTDHAVECRGHARRWYALCTRDKAQVGRDIKDVVERRLLGQISDLARSFIILCRHIESGNVYRSGGGCGEARNHPHRGGFAGTIRPEEADNFAFFYIEGNIVKDSLGAVALCNVVESDHYSPLLQQSCRGRKTCRNKKPPVTGGFDERGIRVSNSSVICASGRPFCQTVEHHAPSEFWHLRGQPSS